VRKSKLSKPDIWMRRLPLDTVIPLASEWRKILLFHPDPIYDVIKRQYCICRGEGTNAMIGCDGCHEWYHYACIGLKGKRLESAKADHLWRCGFCQGTADDEGEVAWRGAVSSAQSKAKKLKLVRSINNTPLSMGVELDAASSEPQRVPPLDEIEEEIRVGGEKLRADERVKRGKASRAIKRGGHHQVDMIGLGGVVPRTVTGRLVDELEQAEMLSEGEGDDDGGSDGSDDE
jgi:hypothetical protein